jgi:hypothetical protein
MAQERNHHLTAETDMNRYEAFWVLRHLHGRPSEYGEAIRQACGTDAEGDDARRLTVDLLKEEVTATVSCFSRDVGEVLDETRNAVLAPLTRAGISPPREVFVRVEEACRPDYRA